MSSSDSDDGAWRGPTMAPRLKGKLAPGANVIVGKKRPPPPPPPGSTSNGNDNGGGRAPAAPARSTVFVPPVQAQPAELHPATTTPPTGTTRSIRSSSGDPAPPPPAAAGAAMSPPPSEVGVFVHTSGAGVASSDVAVRALAAPPPPALPPAPAPPAASASSASPSSRTNQRSVSPSTTPASTTATTTTTTPPAAPKASKLLDSLEIAVRQFVGQLQSKGYTLPEGGVHRQATSAVQKTIEAPVLHHGQALIKALRGANRPEFNGALADAYAATSRIVSCGYTVQPDYEKGRALAEAGLKVNPHHTGCLIAKATALLEARQRGQAVQAIRLAERAATPVELAVIQRISKRARMMEKAEQQERGDKGSSSAAAAVAAAPPPPRSAASAKAMNGSAVAPAAKDKPKVKPNNDTAAKPPPKKTEAPSMPAKQDPKPEATGKHALPKLSENPTAFETAVRQFAGQLRGKGYALPVPWEDSTPAMASRHTQILRHAKEVLGHLDAVDLGALPEDVRPYYTSVVADAYAAASRTVLSVDRTDVQQARTWADKGLKVAPAHGGCFVARAIALLHDGKRGQAVSALNKAKAAISDGGNDPSYAVAIDPKLLDRVQHHAATQLDAASSKPKETRTTTTTSSTTAEEKKAKTTTKSSTAIAPNPSQKERHVPGRQYVADESLRIYHPHHTPMFRKHVQATSKESIGARDAKAFVRRMRSRDDCLSESWFVHLAGVSASLAQALSVDASLAHHYLVDELLGGGPTGGGMKSLVVAVAAHGKFDRRPDLYVSDAAPDSNLTTSTAVLLWNDVAIAFSPLPSQAGRATTGANRGGGPKKGSKVVEQQGPVVAGTVALPRLRTGPWSPTVLLCVRIEAVLQRLRLRALVPAVAWAEAESEMSQVVGAARRAALTASWQGQGGEAAASVLPPFSAVSAAGSRTPGRMTLQERLLQPAVVVPAEASQPILRGADVMGSGIVSVSGVDPTTKPTDALQSGTIVCVAACGNPVPFAVGVALGAHGHEGKCVRVLHTFGDSLWALYFNAAFAATEPALVVGRVPPLALAYLRGVGPTAALPPPSEPLSATSGERNESGTMDEDAGASGDGDDAPAANKKKNKPLPARIAKLQQQKGSKGGGGKKAVQAEARETSELSADAAVEQRLVAALRYVPTGAVPLGFSASTVERLARPALPTLEADEGPSDTGVVAEEDAAAEEAFALKGVDTDDDDDDEGVSDLSDDGDETGAVAVAVEQPSERIVAWTPPPKGLPEEPDAAVHFAVCEALSRLTKGDLPVLASSFVGNYVMRCLPPTYSRLSFEWSWTTGKKPMAAIQKICGGFVTFADAVIAPPPAVAAGPPATSSTPSASPAPQLALVAFRRSEHSFAAHRRFYHTETRFLTANNVVLDIDDVAGDGGGGLIERARALGGKRIDAVRRGLYVTGGMSSAFAAVASFVPSADGPGRSADLAASMSPMNTTPGTPVKFAELRRHLIEYSASKKLLILAKDPETESRAVHALRVAAGLDEKQIAGMRKHARPGDIRLDDVLRPAVEAMARRRRDGKKHPPPAAESTDGNKNGTQKKKAKEDLPYSGESWASIAIVIEALLYGATPTLQVHFADGSLIEHKDPSRWCITLEQRLVWNHWQTWCRGLPFFGIDPTACAERWPAMLACTVEVDTETALPHVVVHARRGRIAALLASIVGIPPDRIRQTVK